MSDKRISPNAPCPCGSGKKYKNCCYGKGFDWVEDDDGNIAKSMPISPELADALEQLRQQFIEQHGREPGPDDLVFPDMSHGEVIEHMMVEGMKQAGFDPAIIYAFEKTGLLVTEENRDLLPDKDLQEWQAAVEEYQAQYGDGEDDEETDYPIGAIDYYGPDDKTTTKIFASVYFDPDLDVNPATRCWVGTNVVEDPEIQQEIRVFFGEHGITNWDLSDGNLGCPHDEGLDYPVGEDCPFCPFWKGKQGRGAEFF